MELFLFFKTAQIEAVKKKKKIGADFMLKPTLM
jgi:hypothetical protein